MSIILLKRGNAADLTSATLLAGEPAFTLDEGKLYVGDGTNKVLINPTYGTAANENVGTGAGQIPVLDSNAKLPTSVMPPIAITETYVVASTAEMLALPAQTGDIAVRTDESKTYVLASEPATTLANWIELLSPQDAPVQSVAGKIGVVVLEVADIQGLQSALDLKANLASPAFTGTPTTTTPSPGDNSSKIASTSFVADAISSIPGAPVTSVNTQVGDVVLGGADLLVTGYAIAPVKGDIVVTDTVNEALGKLEKGFTVIDGGTF